MGFMSILSFAHALVRERTFNGDIAVDATVGNGHDTLFLCEAVGRSGHVYGFDIQEAALIAARERLSAAGVGAADGRYTLFQASHAEMAMRLPAECNGKVAAVMFNLGYLPGGDHRIVTLPDTTRVALDSALELLRSGGVVTAIVYPGHEGGAAEAAAVEQWVAALPQERYQALVYRFANQRNAPPYVVAVEKRR